MELSRVKTKNSDLIVFVISADSDELKALAGTMMLVSNNPDGASALIKKDDPNNRVIVVNDEYFKHIGDGGCLEKQSETPLDKYINAHIIKWNIKPPKKPKSTEKRTKIEID